MNAASEVEKAMKAIDGSILPGRAQNRVLLPSGAYRLDDEDIAAVQDRFRSGGYTAEAVKVEGGILFTLIERTVG